MINHDRRSRRPSRVPFRQRGQFCCGPDCRVGRRSLHWLEDHGGTRICVLYDAGVSSASRDTSMTLSRSLAVAAPCTTTHQPGRRPSCAAVSEKGRQR
jgi:hypothetical protein